MITKIDEEGIKFIENWEDFVSHPYLDIAGVCTIGYGSTYYEDGTKVKLTDPPITEEQAEQLMLNVLTFYEREVAAMTRDDINQHQFNALVSFSYNEGAAALRKSHLLQKVNTNPLDPAIKDEFLRWIY